MATRDGGYARGRARREQIVASATELFARTGFRNATTLEIASAVGISRTGLLHHFPTKDALLEAVLAERDLADASTTAAGGGVRDLRGLVELARHNAEVPLLVSLFAVLSAEATDPAHPAHDYFVRRYETAVASARLTLEQARDEGALAADVDLDHGARAIVAIMDGLQIQWLLDPGAIDMAAQLEAEIQRMLTVPLWGVEDRRNH